MKKLKGILLATSLVVMASTLTACGDDDKVVSQEEYNKLMKTAQQYKSAYTTLNSKMKAESSSLEARNSLVDVTGKGNYEFQTIDNLIKFPQALALKGSFVDANRTNIRVGTASTISPSNNWVMRFKGSITYFDHPSKIHMSVRSIATEYENKPTVEFYKKQIATFYSKFPKGNITYRRVFSGAEVTGVMGTINVTVDKKPHVISALVMNNGTPGLLMVVDYEDNKQGTQQELVDSIVQSTVVVDKAIRLE